VQVNAWQSSSYYCEAVALTSWRDGNCLQVPIPAYLTNILGL